MTVLTCLCERSAAISPAPRSPRPDVIGTRDDKRKGLCQGGEDGPFCRCEEHRRVGATKQSPSGSVELLKCSGGARPRLGMWWWWARPGLAGHREGTRPSPTKARSPRPDSIGPRDDNSPLSLRAKRGNPAPPRSPRPDSIGPRDDSSCLSLRSRRFPFTIYYSPFTVYSSLSPGKRTCPYFEPFECSGGARPRLC